jgi:hypothetical protein
MADHNLVPENPMLEIDGLPLRATLSEEDASQTSCEQPRFRS